VDTAAQLDLLHRVNAYANDLFSYTKETVKRDHWKIPAEFMRDLGGDCEDFSIWKYHMLVRLGYGRDNLRLAHVRVGLDLKVDHMVLLAMTEDGVWHVLDNLNPVILRLDDATEMRIIYTFNESGLWVRDIFQPERYTAKWAEVMACL
jgi:predicted transglutaminase-like cysteine proteinase